MSDKPKVWEFAIAPRRAAIIAVCLAGAGLGVAGAGFTAGLLLAPRFSPVLAEAVRQEEARLATVKTPAQAPKAQEAPKPEVAAAAPEPAKPETEEPQPVATAKAEPEKPAEANQHAKPDDKKPAAAETAPAAKPPIELHVQVASFTSEANAASEVDRLKRSGYPASAVSRTDPSSREWHVVQIGPYYAYETAAKTVLELSSTHRVSPVIISQRTQATP